MRRLGLLLSCIAACTHHDGGEPSDAGMLAVAECPETLEAFRREVFFSTCAFDFCHGPAPAMGLDLREPAEATLVNVPSSCGGRPLVVPGDVTGSYLYEKLTDLQPTCGTVMPPDYFIHPHLVDGRLPASDLACLARLIAEL